MRHLFSFILFYYIFLYSEGYAQKVDDYPFVLNRYNPIGRKFHAEARFTYNCLRKTLVLTRGSTQSGPVVKKGEPFYSYNIQLVHKRFGIEMGRYVKYYPREGIYVKGHRPDGSWLLGYDLNQVVIKEYSETYGLLTVVPYNEKVFDLGISIDTRKIIRIVISKQFKRFSYAININCFYYYDGVTGFSVAYSPFENLSVFEEIVYQGQFGSENNPGYINVFGICAKINSHINMALFHHYFYDEIDKDKVLLYDRNDHRFGFEIKVIY